MGEPNFVLIPGSADGDRLREEPPVDRRMSTFMADLTAIQDAEEAPDLFAALARTVVRAIRADACLVSLLDRDGTVLRDVAASVVPPARLNVVAEEYALEQFPATAEVIKTGESAEISVSNPGEDEAERKFLARLGFGRVLIARLFVEGEPLGTIEAYRLADRPFREDDPHQVEVLAAFAANAYSRIRIAAKLDTSYTETISALMSALEARDPYTEAHTSRIRDLSIALAVGLQVPGEVRRAVKLGAILHDVGKIGIPDAILLKPAGLTDEEWVVMRAHPEIGERMLSSIDFLDSALPIIRHHHERWDGKGYPDRLEGEEIPVGARIVAVCDAFDAMTSDRPYREALSKAAACEELLSNAGSQFDPSCAALLVDVLNRMGEERLDERFVYYAS
jgi:HD-GYP domain-containing protein (c-di-GMP phosphodiesterase class II)